MMAVINIRGDRLYNGMTPRPVTELADSICLTEHIWWDQGTVLRQAGILPDLLPFVDPTQPKVPPQMLRIPVAGIESALMLQDEMSGRSNEMLGPDWGIQVRET